MSKIVLGIICGFVFGAIDIGIMLPMSFPDKKAAIPAAFIARFGIGFVIGAARLPWPGWAVGLCFGLLLSIPDALITKAYAPIIGMGAVGGTIIAFSSGDSGIRFKRLTLIDKSLVVHFWFYKLKLHCYRPMPVKTETIWGIRAAMAVLLIRILAGWVFLSEDIQKFFFPDSLGGGRFVKIGIP